MGDFVPEPDNHALYLSIQGKVDDSLRHFDDSIVKREEYYSGNFLLPKDSFDGLIDFNLLCTRREDAVVSSHLFFPSLGREELPRPIKIA